MRSYELKQKLPIRLAQPVLLSISIDQPDQTAEDFAGIAEAALTAIADRQLTLFIPWQLKKYHFMARGQTEAEALHSAEMLYHQWLDENRETIEKCRTTLSSNFQILTDQKVMEDPIYNDFRTQIYEFYKYNRNFRRLVCTMARSYVKNKMHPKHEDTEQVLDFMRSYQLDQAALVVTLSCKQQYSYEMYSGKRRTEAAQLAFKEFGNPLYMTFMPIGEKKVRPADEEKASTPHSLVALPYAASRKNHSALFRPIRPESEPSASKSSTGFSWTSLAISTGLFVLGAACFALYVFSQGKYSPAEKPSIAFSPAKK